MKKQKQYPRNWEFAHKPSNKWQQVLIKRKDKKDRDVKRNTKTLPDLSPTELYEVIDEGFHHFWSKRGGVPPMISYINLPKR